MSINSNDLGEYIQIRYLIPEKSVFSKTSGGFVSLRYLDEEYPRVNFFKLFPFTLSDRFISVRDNDGKEIGIIESLECFSAEMAEIIKYGIGRRYFIPKILRIDSVNEEFGYLYFEAMTDAGQCKFIVQDSYNSIAPVFGTKYLISDVDGRCFEISDYKKLDIRSLKKIQKYL